MISFFEVEDGDNDAEIFSENELFSAALLLLSSSTSVPLELLDLLLIKALLLSSCNFECRSSQSNVAVYL